MGHGHNHGVDHDAADGSGDNRWRLLIAFGLIFSIVIAQGIGAWVTGSLALLVDMVHSLTDSIGLGVAFVAAILMTRAATSSRTWGFRRVEVLAALGQAVLLLGVGIYAVVEGLQRWAEPSDVAGTELLLFGILGLALNIVAAAVIFSGRRSNFNMKAAFLEVMADALGTVAVIISAVVVITTGYQRADTIAALLIAALILPRAVLLIRDTIRVLMEFTPPGLDLDDVRVHLLELDHVQEVHDLHASTVATGLPTLSAHIVVDEDCFRDGHAAEILQHVRQCVAEHFPVSVPHSTFQIETPHISAAEHDSVKHP